MKRFYQNNILEAGVDEAGRGPLFGRVYSAAVVLNPYDDFNHDLMKDSKKFTSKTKLLRAYDYIKENAIDFSVGYADEDEIDCFNIRKSTYKAMHRSIGGLNLKVDLLLIDGNDFIPYIKPDLGDGFFSIPHKCIVKGDNTYSSIAAASILAKVERDMYINKLCEQNPQLEENYNIKSNKGYGTKKHIDGIKKYGITKFHRKTFNICKQYDSSVGFKGIIDEQLNIGFGNI